MSGERFTLDTNILVYSVDRAAGARHERAKEIVRRARQAACWLTLQAISEFYAVVTREGVMPRAEACRIAGYWLDVFPAVAASVVAVRTALATAGAGTASYWDALLIATAAEAGCAAILTEDMADGSTLHGVRLMNPLAGDEISSAILALLSED
jgi:predicted nucleic acid-binding protein